MSGGVGSSTTALLLAEAGHHVTGITMRLAPPGRPAGQAAVFYRGEEVPGDGWINLSYLQD